MIEVSHGKPRPRALRPDRPPKTAASELAAPYRDPRNGRFGAGNPGGRLRQLATLARVTAESLLRLEPDAVAPWLRGHLRDAQEHVQRLVDALPAKTDELVGLCGDEGRARLFAAACATEGSRDGTTPEDARAWRQESREWQREVRQVVLTRRAIARDVAAEDPDEAELRRQQAAYQASLEARQNGGKR